MKKLQSQPEHIRKLILWLTVISVGVVLFFFWIKYAQKKLEEFSEENLKEQFQPSQALEEQFKDLSGLGTPSIDEQTLKELEELLKEAAATTTTTTQKQLNAE